MRMICAGEWYIRKYFIKEVTMRLDLSYLSVPKLFTERLALFRPRDVKPCCLGRANGSTTLFPHAEYIIMDCLLQTPQIQLSEIAIYITKYQRYEQLSTGLK